MAEVVEHGRGKKVINFKYKAKTRYRRKRGHRQGYTKLSVKEILPTGAGSSTGGAAPRSRRAPVVETPPVEGDDAEIDAEDIVNATSGNQPTAGETAAAPPSPRRRGRVTPTPPVEGDDAEIDAEDIVNATRGESSPDSEQK